MNVKNENNFESRLFAPACVAFMLCFTLSFSPFSSAMSDQGIRQLTVNTVIPELMSIESKAEVISSKLDTLPTALHPELWSIESKAEVISSKIDALPRDASELWSIESKAEIISSKIDTIPGTITPELWSIESKAETISSKADILINYTGCESIPLRSSDIVGGVITISTPGNYCLAMDMTATVSITAPNVCLDLNCRELTGNIIITAENVTIKDGTVTSPAPLNNSDAEQAAITISAAGTRSLLQNMTIECLSLADTTVGGVDGINGRSAINNNADSVQIIDCQIQAGNGQGIKIVTDSDIIINNNTGNGGTGITNTGTAVQITNCSVAAGNSGQIYADAQGNTLVANYGTATIGAGGSGITNTGAAVQITSCSVAAGNSGQIYSHAQQSTYVANYGTATIGAGGSGIINTGATVQITSCSVAAGNSGQIYSHAQGYTLVAYYGTATIGDAGDAILTTTNSSGTITNCMLSTTHGGSIIVSSGSIYGSANGANGGNGITCDGASNLQIVNCLVKQTGNGGNGFRGSSGQNPSYPGNGGNGGNGILVKSNCTNIEVRRNSIANTGTYGLGGGSPAVNGIAGMAIQDLIPLGTYSSAIFENFASDIANTTQRYKINNSTTEGGRAQSQCHDYLDNIYDNGDGQIYRTCSVVEDINSSIDNVVTPELWSIESKAEIISSKIDTIPGQLTPELWSIESKAEVISSKVDTIPETITPELWSIESKAEVISSKVDTLGSDKTELWSIESKAEVISSKIDTIPGQITPELWSIESKAEVISSKIDNVYNSLVDGVSSINSALANVTPVSINNPTPATIALNSATSTIYDEVYQISRIPYTGSFPSGGKYYLYQNESSSITISTSNVTLDLNGFSVTGSITINANNVVVKNGMASSINNRGSYVLIIDCYATQISTYSGSYVSLINCEASNNGTSDCFDLSGSYIYLEQCIAKNGINGFDFRGATTNIVFKGCVTQNNTTAFNLELVALNNIVLEKCIANNDTNGFVNNNAANTGIVRECIVHAISYGFSDVPTSQIKYVANYAQAGTLPYSTGSNNPPFYSQPAPTGTSTISYWNNVYY